MPFRTGVFPPLLRKARRQAATAVTGARPTSDDMGAHGLLALRQQPPLGALSLSEGTYKTRDTRFSQKVNSISASGIRRFFELIANMDGCISLGVGEPDFVTPERYMRAAFDSAMAGETHYLELRATGAARSR